MGIATGRDPAGYGLVARIKRPNLLARLAMPRACGPSLSQSRDGGRRRAMAEAAKPSSGARRTTAQFRLTAHRHRAAPGPRAVDAQLALASARVAHRAPSPARGPRQYEP